MRIRSAFLSVFVALLIRSSTLAQSATVVDVNSEPIPTDSGARAENPAGFQVMGGRIVTVADDGVHGTEIHLIDSTTKQRTLLDIRPGAESSNPQQVVVDAGRIWFSADDGVHGRELWSSNGTAAGTSMIADLWPGSTSSNPGGMTACGSRVVFGATTPGRGIELFVSDGTPSGTGLLFEFVPGLGLDGYPQSFTKDPTGPRVYFSAHTTSFGRELWITDGTATGTKMVIDLVPGKDASDPHGLTAVGSRLVFGTTSKLYATDGTAAGTTMLRNGIALLESSAILGVSNTERLFFSAFDARSGYEVFETDGTPNGTKLFADLSTGSGSSSPFRFARLSATTMSFFVYDWQATTRIAQLWFSDGTLAGTRLVATFPGMASTSARSVASGNAVFFDLFPITGHYNNTQLFVSRGTAATTGLVAQTSGLDVLGVRDMTSIDGGRVVLQGRDRRLGSELFIADPGTLDLLADIQAPIQNTKSSQPRSTVRLGDKLLFTADDGLHGRELWIHGPTSTRLVLDLVPGSTGSDPSQLCAFGDKVVFSASTPSTGIELFVTDGTAHGTTLLADLVPGSGSGLPSHMRRVGEIVLFAATDPSTGAHSVWRTNGRPAGTSRVIALPTSILDMPRDFARIGGHIYFVANGTHWACDGTLLGLRTLHRFPVDEALQIGSKIFFVGWSLTHGTELGVTDGTTAGSVLFDLRPGTLSSQPDGLARHADKLLFTCLLNGNKYQICESDGTLAGTKPVLTTLYDQAPRFLTSAGSQNFLFTANSAQGYELQISDGSDAGTRTYVDIWPGGDAYPSAEASFSWVRGHVYCTAYTPRYGSELWRVDAAATSLRAGQGCGFRNQVPDLRLEDPVLGANVRLDVRDAVTGSVMLLLIGSEANIGTFPAPGCFSEVDLLRPFVTLAVPMASSDLSATVKVPNDTALRGVTTVWQSFFLGSPLAFAEASNALHVTFGD